MTLAPEAVRSSSASAAVWEKALIEFVRQASNEGKTVVVSTDVQTMTPDSRPMPATHNPPAALYRGNRCLSCLQTGPTDRFGLCPACADQPD